MTSANKWITKYPIPCLLVVALALKISYLVFGNLTGTVNKQLSYFDQYISIAHKFDSDWYEKIAVNDYPILDHPADFGYSKGADIKQSEWAFFPFYPKLAHTLIKITGFKYTTVAFWINIFFTGNCIAGIFIFFRRHFKDKKKAFFTTLLLFLFPFSFYFHMFYSEVIFLSFLIYSFISIQRRQYLATAWFIVPMCLLRPNGIILLLPMFLYLLEDRGHLKDKLSFQAIFKPKSLKNIMVFSSGVIAFLAFLVYQWNMTGDFFAFSKAQAGWGRSLTFPLFSLFTKGTLATQYNSFFTIALLVFAFSQRKKWPISFNVLVWLSILLPLSSGSVTSMARFASILFPLFISIGSILYLKNSKWLVLTGITCLHFVSLYFWLIGNPIAY